MKIRRNEHNAVIGPSGVRQGFTLNDTYRLRKYDNPLSNPPTQIISAEEIEPEPENRDYWCASCKSKLEFLKGSETIWRCDDCTSYYDTRIQDNPLKDITDFKLTPYADLMHYPTVDRPFLEAINPGEQQDESLQQRIYSDRRVQTIHVNGSFAEAIKAGILPAIRNQIQT